MKKVLFVTLASAAGFALLFAQGAPPAGASSRALC